MGKQQYEGGVPSFFGSMPDKRESVRPQASAGALLVCTHSANTSANAADSLEEQLDANIRFATASIASSLPQVASAHSPPEIEVRRFSDKDSRAAHI